MKRIICEIKIEKPRLKKLMTTLFKRSDYSFRVFERKIELVKQFLNILNTFSSRKKPHISLSS